MSGPCRSSDTPVWQLRLTEICQPESGVWRPGEGVDQKEGRPRIGTPDTDFLRSQRQMSVDRVDDWLWSLQETSTDRLSFGETIPRG